MNLTIPELSLVVVIGASGSGKSTFARAHFLPTEVLSSDACRALVSDDENNQAATNDAFDVLHYIAAKRLAAGKLTVVDATNVQQEGRKPLVALARQYHVLPVAIVLNLPERVCQARNEGRPNRAFGPHVVRNQTRNLRQSLRGLQREGFRHVFVLSSEDEIAAATITRQPLWNNRKDDHGPFDIIGDVHGCFDELRALLESLGYAVTVEPGTNDVSVMPPEGRKAVFLGDLVDRGGATPSVLRLVMGMVARGDALCVPGNHDVKLVRKLRGRDGQITHGLAASLAQLDGESPAFREAVAAFLDGLVSHYVLDDGKLVVAHAGMKQEMQGRGSGGVREFALYGETTGETDTFGLPVRYDWAAAYRGTARVVYGHTPVPEAEWLNGTINIDTGCVFGGKLTALRYPEMEIVSVPARHTYAEPARPFIPEAAQAAARVLTAQQEHDDLLDMADVSGKRQITTRLHHTVTIREENATAALEAMSRFAVDPKWLIYLPPTMSPCETSRNPDFLEHPAEAFAYYRHQGIAEVICEAKHMGSRAIVIVCQDAEVVRTRFGIREPGIGICYTRTGRRFFDDLPMEAALVHRVKVALDATGFWERFNTDWACFDCEMLPWSAKAQGLIQQQYAATGAAARAALGETVAALAQACANGAAVDDLLAQSESRATMTAQYVEAYRRYCWPVASIADLRLAPFHLLATEGAVHTDKDHRWHLEALRAICNADDAFFLATAQFSVNVTDAESEAAGVAWWMALTEQGGEGMVVKPVDFIARGRRGLVQPAVKCRGREYLRIIYGPEYTAANNIERLRERGLAAKRSLALREFALGIEALERFVRREPLRRVHECVFGVLALESEPIDPRL